MTVGTAAVLLALTACGGSDDTVAGPTTRLTLLPTTTTTEPVLTTTTEAAPVTTLAVTTSPAPPAEASTTTDAAPPTTAAPVDPAVEALVLSDEGIGAAVFSGDPDGVVAYLSSFVGPPTADTGWVDPFDISACAGTQLRVVSFGSLRLTFGDVSPVLEGRPHFFAYTYGDYDFDGVTVTVTDQTPEALVTENGVGLGTDLVALEAVHPGIELNPSDDFFPETFVINDNLRGALSGLADDSTVVQIVGGQDCADPT